MLPPHATNACRIRADPTSALLTNNLRAAEAMLAQSGQRAGSGTPAAPPPVGSPAASSTASRRGPLLAGRAVLSFLLLVYVFPFGVPRDLSRTAFYAAMVLAAVVHVVDLVTRLGLPSHARDVAYVLRASRDPSFHIIFLPLVWLTSPAPSPLAAIAVASFDVLHFGVALYGEALKRGGYLQRTSGAEV